MADLSDLLLTALINHGTVLLGGSLFLAALGVPLPATMLLMAAGAFSQQGVLDLGMAAGAAWAGAVAGDLCSYGVGRFASDRLPQTWRQGAGWKRAEQLFARWGVLGVFVTRFALTPAALPVNLMAGSTHFAWSRFVSAVLAGEALWVAWVGGVGFVFFDQWEAWSRWVGDFGGILLGAALLVIGLVVLFRHRRSKP